MATSGSPIGRPPNRRSTSPIVELSESECLDHLRRVAVGRLAVQLGAGGVDIFPVNFALDGQCVVLRTDGGTKLDSLKEHPLVAFEVDHFDYFERTAWSVVIKGRASLVEDYNELFELLTVEIETWQPERKPFFVRITPSSTTGRRFAIRRRVES